MVAMRLKQVEQQAVRRLMANSVLILKLPNGGYRSTASAKTACNIIQAGGMLCKVVRVAEVDVMDLAEMDVLMPMMRKITRALEATSTAITCSSR